MRENKILEIKYYVLPFFLFTFTLIVFQNFFIFLFVLFLSFLYFLFLSYKYKNLNFITILFVIASVCLWSYIFFMYKTLDKLEDYKKHFTTKNYKIIDLLRGWDYLVEDDFSSKFILKVNKIKSKTYTIWDNIRVYWSFFPINAWFKNFDDFRFRHFLSTSFELSKIKDIFNFDYNRYLMMKWISASIYAKKIYFVDNQNIGLDSQFKIYIKNKISSIYKDFDDKYKALILWILIWDKTFLSNEIYKQFIYSWLVHIIVVSWANIMFLVIFLSFVLWFIPFYIRLVVIWICIVFYSAVAGFDSSVLRAVIMWVLSLIALFFWKLSDTRRILSLAFIIMIVYNPYFLLYDLWFVLSFLAILWILFTSSFKITQDWRIIKFYNNYILPTLWASLFTAPAILLFTKKLNLFAVFSSILVLPLLPLLMLINLFTLISFWKLQSLFLYLSIWIMDWIFYISYVFSSYFSFFIGS